ncbi:MAG: hypothetical protein QOG64_217 [Acidimicrobiaceae bacterium]|nr:hypothetical protein [Acidimicrobiaceae bacterium]
MRAMRGTRARLVVAAVATLMTAVGVPAAIAGSTAADLVKNVYSSSTVTAARSAGTRIQGGPSFKIGFAKQSVDPRPAEIASGQLHLGGFGLAPTRASTGPLVDGDGTVEHIYARAMAVTNAAGRTMLLAALENQGTFAAYKQGPYGLSDVRDQVAHDTGVPADMIVINSDHSHAGPDLIGLWGGVPVGYLQYVHDQTVKALDQAFARRVPGRLLVGSDTPVMPDPATGGYLPGSATPGENLVHSQFGADTLTGYHDETVDTQLRVLHAVDTAGRPLGTLINYAAHATVMGGDNVRYSADWPGRVARATEQALFEPVAVTMVADVGRSQPPRPHSDPQADQPGHPSGDVDKLDTYTRLLTPWVLHAVATSRPAPGSTIAGQEVFTREPATNAALLGVSYTGEAPVRGYGAYRAVTEPWVAGDVIGTYVSAHRIGNLLFTAAPGEAYPDIRFGVQRAVKGASTVFTFGLANDQLGYLIGPASEYPWITASQPGNDNAFFNVSATYGDHVTCSQSAASTGIGFVATGDPQPYGPQAAAPACPLLTAADGVGAGPAVQQPWPFGDGVTLPPPFPQ